MGQFDFIGQAEAAIAQAKQGDYQPLAAVVKEGTALVRENPILAKPLTILASRLAENPDFIQEAAHATLAGALQLPPGSEDEQKAAGEWNQRVKQAAQKKEDPEQSLIWSAERAAEDAFPGTFVEKEAVGIWTEIMDRWIAGAKGANRIQSSLATAMNAPVLATDDKGPVRELEQQAINRTPAYADRAIKAAKEQVSQPDDSDGKIRAELDLEYAIDTIKRAATRVPDDKNQQITLLKKWTEAMDALADVSLVRAVVKTGEAASTSEGMAQFGKEFDQGVFASYKKHMDRLVSEQPDTYLSWATRALYDQKKPEWVKANLNIIAGHLEEYARKDMQKALKLARDVAERPEVVATPEGQKILLWWDNRTDQLAKTNPLAAFSEASRAFDSLPRSQELGGLGASKMLHYIDAVREQDPLKAAAHLRYPIIKAAEMGGKFYDMLLNHWEAAVDQAAKIDLPATIAEVQFTVQTAEKDRDFLARAEGKLIDLRASPRMPSYDAVESFVAKFG